MIWARIEISKERTIVLQMNILWIISISQVFDCWLVCSNIWNCEEKSPNFEMVCGTIRSCLIWKFQSIMRRVRKSLASSIADINRTRALNWTIYARFSGCRTKSFHFFVQWHHLFLSSWTFAWQFLDRICIVTSQHLNVPEKESIVGVAMMLLKLLSQPLVVG